MSSVTREYDIGEYYRKILHDICYNSPKIRMYLCKKNEPSINQQILPQLKALSQTFIKIIYLIDLIELCFLYEIEQYKTQTSLSEAEQQDKNACESLYWQLHNIKMSFRKSQSYISSIRLQFESLSFSSQSNVKQAVEHMIRVHNTRCNEIFQRCLLDFVLQSILRPYWIHLNSKRIDLQTDMLNHVHIGAQNWNELQQKFQPYLQKIITFAETSGKTTYKIVRQEEWLATIKKRNHQKEIHKQKQKERQAQRYIDQIQRFCKKQEQSYQNTFKTGHQHFIIQQILQHPKYDKNAKTCCYLACLCKGESGPRVFQYYDSDKLTRYQKELHTFFFDPDETEIKKAKEHALTFPDVKAVDCITVY